jgi:hypothetical protein
MSSADVETVTKMLESLPESVQEQVIDHMREYIANLRDELEWNASFKRTESQLVEAARRARREMAEEKAEPMDYEQL